MKIEDGTWAIDIMDALLSAAATVVVALEACDPELRAEAVGLFRELKSGEVDQQEHFATICLLADILFPESKETAE